MIRPLAIAFALTAALSAPAAQAADAKLAGVTVRQAWSRPAQAGMNGVGFMTLVNGGKTPVTLKGVESPAAGVVEIHQSSMAGGVMSMRRVDDGVVVPPGGEVAFAPGGLHLMLLNLKAAQTVGQKVPMTLIFDNGRRAAVALEVRLAPPQAAQASSAAGHRHH
ncbi:copper chaperone PCu(A)C [uncultured Caulobacter sp.]|uniref:copper chaperone PCu(A)C n=1 Tax=uncultured Caulobacter sp. TaxID=158749 RepID=UPI002613FFBC|nr:copper chaperone PCu(A)C [uncultured Caulobacter sp.]